MVPMHVVKVLQKADGPECFLLLADEPERRYLPIGVGVFEAAAIVRGAKRLPAARPMTHDLTTLIITRLRGTVERLLVHDLREKTFIGQLEIATDRGLIEVDCRPSDGVAIAVRVGCPILVADEILTEAAIDADALPADDDDPSGVD